MAHNVFDKVVAEDYEGCGMTVEILLGDCREVLKGLPDASVNCCVTSPPYFGLRDYGVEGQIGLEQTPDEYVAEMVAVFREVRRVLRDDGTLWLNLGDSYARTGGTDRKVSATAKVGSTRNTLIQMSDRTSRATTYGLKDKDLIGIPWRVAFALQADGWYLRQDVIWHKPNPMPESVRDRCTKAHEYIFLMSKSPKYFFDADAIKEPAVNTRMPGRKIKETTHYGGMNGGNTGLTSFIGKYHENGLPTHRNRRSVWTVSTKPFKGAHFATFPPDLIEPCILAGCPVGGTVLDPFGGSGTTALVALRHGRNAALIELNPEYVQMARERLGMLAEDAA